MPEQSLGSPHSFCSQPIICIHTCLQIHLCGDAHTHFKRFYPLRPFVFHCFCSLAQRPISVAFSECRTSTTNIHMHTNTRIFHRVVDGDMVLLCASMFWRTVSFQTFCVVSASQNRFSPSHRHFLKNIFSDFLLTLYYSFHTQTQTHKTVSHLENLEINPIHILCLRMFVAPIVRLLYASHCPPPHYRNHVVSED